MSTRRPVVWAFTEALRGNFAQMTEYFSDRELGPPPRVLDDLPDTAWGGIVAGFHRAMDSHRFADSFPEQCPDGQGISGTSIANLAATLQAHIPGLPWPLRADTNSGALIAMDLVEFVWRYVSLPEPFDHHGFFHHDHYRVFDQATGRKRWRDETNQILNRNGVALELETTGFVTRIGPLAAQIALNNELPPTGDLTLDALLQTAVRKYRDPDPITRLESLEHLWDALERVKTILDSDKKKGVAALIERMSGTPEARVILDEEFAALTAIGNKFHIRHHETTKTPVPPEMVDALFVRTYALLESAVRILSSATS